MTALAVLTACSSRDTATPGQDGQGSRVPRTLAADSDRPETAGPTSDQASRTGALPGMPPVLDPNDLYAAGRPGQLSPVVASFPSLVYVPNSGSNTVDIIDPATFQIVGHFPVGAVPQHVVPSWDLKTLWVNDNEGNDLIPIDPATGQPGQPVPVEDPYNLYFTPDGKYAVVMASLLRRVDFLDPHTMQLIRSLPVPCLGVNHADFSADGRYFIASCEFSGHMVKVDTWGEELLGVTDLRQIKADAMPQDVKISPDGKTWYVADMKSHGVWTLDGETLQPTGFIATGVGAHGLYVSRDSKYLYVSNRDEGSISLVDFATQQVTTTWRIPGGGSPDMGGVSADGTVLWLAGRYHSEVYAISTADGRLIKRIPVGSQPHGLCIYPQPGRYSLGHTGIFR